MLGFEQSFYCAKNLKTNFVSFIRYNYEELTEICLNAVTRFNSTVLTFGDF